MAIVESRPLLPETRTLCNGAYDCLVVEERGDADISQQDDGKTLRDQIAHHSWIGWRSLLQAKKGTTLEAWMAGIRDAQAVDQSWSHRGCR